MKLHENEKLSDVLFWFQIFFPWIYFVPQIMFILSGRVGGLNIASFILFFFYLTISLTLAVASYNRCESPEGKKIRKRTIIVFSQMVFILGILTFFGMKKINWTDGDFIICSLVLFLSILTLIKYQGFSNPIGRGFLSIWFKSVPQLWLALTMIMAESSEGLPWVSLIAGFLTAFPRLALVWISGRKDGWDEPTKGLFMGEFPNILTWIVVFIVWVIFRIQ